MYSLAIRKCTSPPLLAPRLEIFKWKFTYPPGIEPRTFWTRGKHAIIWASAASRVQYIMKLFQYSVIHLYSGRERRLSSVNQLSLKICNPLNFRSLAATDGIQFPFQSHDLYERLGRFNWGFWRHLTRLSSFIWSCTYNLSMSYKHSCRIFQSPNVNTNNHFCTLITPSLFTLLFSLPSGLKRSCSPSTP